MKIDLYQSAVRTGKLLAVPAGKDIRAWRTPPEFDVDLLQVHPLLNTLNIKASDERLLMDSSDVVEQIEQKGWALVEVHTKIVVSDR